MRTDARTPVYRVRMVSSGGYPHYPHSRKPPTGRIMLAALLAVAAFFCCCGAGMFVALEPATTTRIVKSIFGRD
jgi:hypothetical protein